MAYVAVKGGEQAILNSQKLLAERRRGDRSIPELTIEQIAGQFGLAVDRVMSEGSVYDRRLAALALKQAQGDALEAIFLLRAYRTTLERFAFTLPLDTSAMRIQRRISATFKDIPGGQILGPTYDYTHRLLGELGLEIAEQDEPVEHRAGTEDEKAFPSVVTLFDKEGIVEAEPASGDSSIFDLTREPMRLPASRDQRLQNLARGEEGFLLGLAYSAARGYGGSHPFVAELRMGEVDIFIEPVELGFKICIGSVSVTECQMISKSVGGSGSPPQFDRGYGLSFGGSERKAISMALVDRSLRSAELGNKISFPVQDESFVLSHTDSVEASGFISHYKLPHYVDFQAEAQLIRRLRAEFEQASSKAAE